MRLRIEAVLVISLLSFSCASAPKHPFSEPTKMLKEQIDKRVSELRYTHGMELMNHLDWLVRCGENAYPTLIDALDNGDATTRAGAANVLGRCNDRRVIPFLSEHAKDTDPRMRFEVARALLRLGDWTHIPVLIDGMRDGSEYVRALCNDALKQSTQIDFGFVANATAEEREEKVKKWETWWSARSKDPAYSTSASSYSRKNNSR